MEYIARTIESETYETLLLQMDKTSVLQAYLIETGGSSFTIPGAGEVKVAVVSGLGNTRKLMEAIDKGWVEYDFVEVMACPGGGQPIHDGIEMAEARGEILWNLDKNAKLRFSHENPDVQALYAEFLGRPLGHKSHHLLHTDHHGWEMPKNPRLK